MTQALTDGARRLRCCRSILKQPDLRSQQVCHQIRSELALPPAAFPASGSTIQEVRRSYPPLQLLSLSEGEYPSQGQMPTKNVLYPPIVFYSAVATVLFNHDELYRERYLPFICCRYCVSAEFLLYIWEFLIC